MPRPPRVKPPTLLYLDEHLVVVDKPAHLLSAPGRGQEPTVADWLRTQPSFRANPAVRIVHRLDREASGVLIFARTIDAQRHLVAQFVRRAVEKLYFALVTGYVSGDGEIGLSLVFDKRRNRMATTTGRGLRALTHYRVAERVAGNTLLECRPVTGRTHQIRTHLAAIGHPLAVDPLYGGAAALYLSQYKADYRPSRRRPERALIERLTLHAARIRFVHPIGGEPLSFEAPTPKDLRATLTQLGRLVGPATRPADGPNHET